MIELPHHTANKKIAVIGGSFSGILTALLLRAYGFKAIDILEKSESVFPQHASFMNAGTLIHHLNFGGDKESFQKMISACLFFLRVFPSHVYSATRANLLLPNDSENPAIHGESSALNNLAELRRIYKQHVATTGHPPFGSIKKLFRTLDESELRQQYGSIGGKSWLGVDGVFHSAFDVAQFFADPDALIRHLYRHLFSTDGNAITLKTSSHVSSIIPVINGFDVGGESASFGTYSAVIGQAHAGNFSLRMPGLSEKLPCHMRRKGLLLMDGKGLSIPPTVMIRGFYGALLPVGNDQFLVISGRHFDLDEIHFPGDGQDLEQKLHQWDTAPIDTYSSWSSEEQFATAVIDDVAERLPIVRKMRLIRPIFGTHVYDPSRKDAAVDVASVRDKNLIAHEFVQKDAVALLAGHTKLTTIPMSSVHIVSRVLATLSGGKHPGIPFTEYGFPIIPDQILGSWITKDVVVSQQKSCPRFK